MLEQNNHTATDAAKPHVVLMGQTPPPWHGQAVATQILFDHDWPDFEVTKIRMDYSEEMDEVGRFHLKKLGRLFHLIRKTRQALCEKPESTLLYPPASARWIPFLRDVIFLAFVRPKAAKTIFIFHASGLAAFTRKNPIADWFADIAYGDADMALEVAEEQVSPHEVFKTKDHLWCPCGIEAPPMDRHQKLPGEITKVLFVGSLQEGKGVLEILKTAHQLRESGQEQCFRFDIVGRWMDGEFRRKAMSLHAKLELGDYVRFPGQLTGEDKWRAYHDADVFFFPSHYHSEASPLVLMEALAAGLPIVTTAWNGIPALMHGCSTAVLLPVKSPQQFAEALREFAENSVTANDKAERSRKFYEDNFQPKCFVQRVTGAFQAVINPHGIEKLRALESSDSSLNVSAYLADQNPGHDRSMGISRMSDVILETLAGRDEVDLHVVVSRSSQRGPKHRTETTLLPWGTRHRIPRIFSDHLHPILSMWRKPTDIWFYPKGFLPHFFSSGNVPTAVTVHDTIIQHYWDKYPGWRPSSEYIYWAHMLKHTLRKADGIFTVSENAKAQIESFMDRHEIKRKDILVTYEPCVFEKYPQPENPPKEDYVIHLSSKEPHKRTEDLIMWWHERAQTNQNLPILELVGKIPAKCASLVSESNHFNAHPFLEDADLVKVISRARALVLPSEIEGFGLPAIEAYYLGTPVCYNLGTSIEEILIDTTPKGGFHLAEPSSLWTALDVVMAMPPEEIRSIGLSLREKYASEKIAERILKGLNQVIIKNLEN
ncbi:MAG: glycosyltransferase [Luteolibacter sp.]